MSHVDDEKQRLEELSREYGTALPDTDTVFAAVDLQFVGSLYEEQGKHGWVCTVHSEMLGISEHLVTPAIYENEKDAENALKQGTDERLFFYRNLITRVGNFVLRHYIQVMSEIEGHQTPQTDD